MGRRVDVSQLVDTKEIAVRLGLASGQVVREWQRRYLDFPEPVAELAGGKIWVWSEVEAWSRRTGHPKFRTT